MKDYFQRIDAMLATHQMPSEYQNTKSLIYCNDCELKSVAPFHFLYHKCQSCQGYNTKVLQTVDERKGGSLSALNIETANMTRSSSQEEEVISPLDATMTDDIMSISESSSSASTSTGAGLLDVLGGAISPVAATADWDAMDLSRRVSLGPSTPVVANSTEDLDYEFSEENTSNSATEDRNGFRNGAAGTPRF